MELYGPPLPPGYKNTDDEDFGISGTLHHGKSEKERPKFIGPHIPDFLSKKQKLNDNTNLSDVHDNLEASDLIGPELPPSFKVSEHRDEKFHNPVIGPELPPSFNISGDEIEDVYGPMPAESREESDDVTEKKAAIEKRAEDMKKKLDNKKFPVAEAMQREEWMVVPDTSRRNQLGAISRCLAPSSKKSSTKEKHSHRSSEKDKKTAEELKKYNKSKRSKSLLEIHKDDKKKKEKKSSKVEERKAFDRDEIAVRHFTTKQVNSVIDKAKKFNSRFAAGSQQYL